MTAALVCAVHIRVEGGGSFGIGPKISSRWQVSEVQWSGGGLKAIYKSSYVPNRHLAGAEVGQLVPISLKIGLSTGLKKSFVVKVALGMGPCATVAVVVVVRGIEPELGDMVAGAEASDIGDQPVHPLQIWPSAKDRPPRANSIMPTPPVARRG
jgi:hypothetical protein